MLHFKQALLKSVAPRLKLLGYQYDDVLGDREITYGFHKHLGNDIRAIIEFQRHQEHERPYGYGFTVNMMRVKAPEIAQWHRGNYDVSLFDTLGEVLLDMMRGKAPEIAQWHRGNHEVSLSARLGEVLWFFYGLRIYSSYDKWWEPQNANELEEVFTDVLDKLERYGMPWLEDPQSKFAWPLSAPEWNEFQETLLTTVMQELERLGYKTIEDPKLEWHPSRGKPQHNFTKPIVGDLRAFIIFHPMKFLEPRMFDLDVVDEQLNFDVILLRKWLADPYDQNWVANEERFEVWLSQHLRSTPAKSGPSMPPMWHYTNREELIAQLKDALDKMKRYGIPLLEDPGTKNPRFRKADS